MDSDFEQRLRRQPVKKVPEAWRADILSAARQARPIHHSSFVIRHSLAASERSGGGWLSTFNYRLSTLLWPHPKAWAGLAAVWVVIVALNFSIRDKPPVLAQKSAPPSPEMVAELKQQRKMLAELIGPAELSVADRQRFLSPKPHSQRMETLAV